MSTKGDVLYQNRYVYSFGKSDRIKKINKSVSLYPGPSRQPKSFETYGRLMNQMVIFRSPILCSKTEPERENETICN